VLDEKSDKSLVCGEGSSVDTEWGFLFSIFIRIDEIKSLGNCEIKLIRRERELPTDRAPDLDIDLWSVESGFIIGFDKWNS
jgi:hypothetical protein